MASLLVAAPAVADITIQSKSASLTAQGTDFFHAPGQQVIINAPDATNFTDTAEAKPQGHSTVHIDDLTSQDTKAQISGDNLTLTSSQAFSMLHTGSDDDRQNLISETDSLLTLKFCTTTTSSFQFSASGQMTVPPGKGTTGNFRGRAFADAFVLATFTCDGCPQIAFRQFSIGVNVGPTNGVPNQPSGSTSGSGTIPAGCYEVSSDMTAHLTSPLLCKNGPNTGPCEPFQIPPDENTSPPSAKGSFTLELEVAPTSAGEDDDGSVFRWVGPSQGGFGDDQNWDPQGVPAFVVDTRSDTALFQGVSGVQVDVNALGNSAAHAAAGPLVLTSRAATVPGCAGPITRAIGRLVLDGSQNIDLRDGALALDGVSFFEPALTLQNQGLLQLDNSTICTLNASVGRLGRPSFAFVTGPGGVLQTRERLSIGAEGEGTLAVRDQGIATSEEVRLGDGSKAGFADVSNATWHTGDIAVGFHSPGELIVENAGLLQSEEGFVQFQLPFPDFTQFGNDAKARCLGRTDDDGSGVEVRGAGSKWSLQHLEIGGGGCVEVRDQGLLESAAGDASLGEVEVGTTSSGRASLEIDNGVMTTANTTIVGDQTEGHLDVVDHDLGHAQAQVLDLIIGRSEGEDVRNGGFVTVTGDVFTDQDILIANTIEVAEGAHGFGDLTIGPHGSVRTSTTASVATEGGVGSVELNGDPQLPQQTVWNISSSLEVGSDASTIPFGTISIRDAVINVGSPSSTGQVTIHKSGALLANGGVNVVRTNGGLIHNDGQIIGPITLDGHYDGASTGQVVSTNSAPPPPPPPAPVRGGGSAEALGITPRAVKTPPPVQGPLIVTGDADFSNSTLVLQFTNGFAPHQGDAFPVVDVQGQVIHGFGAVQVLGLAAGAQFDVDAQTGIATSLSDTVALPIVTIKAPAKLKESAKKGAKVTFTRTGPTTDPLTVDYGIGGTAETGIDYGPLPGAITIPAKKKSATLVIVPFADGLPEPPETIVLTLLPGDDYAPSSTPTATITLLSTEKPPKKK